MKTGRPLIKHELSRIDMRIVTYSSFFNLMLPWYMDIPKTMIHINDIFFDVRNQLVCDDRKDFMISLYESCRRFKNV